MCIGGSQRNPRPTCCADALRANISETSLVPLINEHKSEKEEIREALGVAVAMNAGAALIYSTRVLDAVEAKTQQARSA